MIRKVMIAMIAATTLLSCTVRAGEPAKGKPHEQVQMQPPQAQPTLADMTLEQLRQEIEAREKIAQSIPWLRGYYQARVDAESKPKGEKK